MAEEFALKLENIDLYYGYVRALSSINFAVRPGETVALLMHSGRDRVCVAELPSPQPLSFRRGVGHRENVTLGASGRTGAGGANVWTYNAFAGLPGFKPSLPKGVSFRSAIRRCTRVSADTAVRDTVPAASLST